MTYKYRVYVDRIRDGDVCGYYNDYAEAEAKFDDVVASGYGAVYLQELNPTFGWVDIDIKVHETEFHKAQKKSYWKRREEEESDWRAGDAPWDAPGMSTSDFF